MNVDIFLNTVSALMIGSNTQFEWNSTSIYIFNWSGNFFFDRWIYLHKLVADFLTINESTSHLDKNFFFWFNIYHFKTKIQTKNATLLNYCDFKIFLILYIFENFLRSTVKKKSAKYHIKSVVFYDSNKF